MQIVHVRQGSEEWENLRHRPTASEFSSFCTLVKGDYSKSATAYAAKIVAKRLGAYVEPPPSFWMEWGIENEPNAIEAYTAQTKRTVTEAGFVFPDHTDAYGCSPDGLVGADGMIQVKCPKPETLIMWHAKRVLPLDHKAQVQGELWICDREWSDFYAWHPHVAPLLIRVFPDKQYHHKLAKAMQQLLKEIQYLEDALVPF